LNLQGVALGCLLQVKTKRRRHWAAACCTVLAKLCQTKLNLWAACNGGSCLLLWEF
jgi:hypothetical protein